jgi:hypothetical protein
MMPSADHETVLPNTTKIPVKNNIEQSPLTRAIRSPFCDAGPYVYCSIHAFFPIENQLSTLTKRAATILQVINKGRK